MKIKAAVAVAVLMGAAGVVGFSGSVSAAPTPVVCVPHTADISLFPTATLRVTVKECYPIDDALNIVSVCKTETLIKANGATAVVENTCETTATSK